MDLQPTTKHLLFFLPQGPETRLLSPATPVALCGAPGQQQQPQQAAMLGAAVAVQEPGGELHGGARGKLGGQREVMRAGKSRGSRWL